MTQLNPEVEGQLSALAKLCCQAMEGDSESLLERSEPLLKSLLLSGFARACKVPLQVELERRIADQCRDNHELHRGDVSGLTRPLQEKFDELVRWESRQPRENNPPKAANISSATDS